MSRTDKIIGRFPDFYQSHETENLLYKYVSVFAALLDVAEEDLLGIMRTHWVKTADNAGSKGFDAAEKGDLDKIFALYLESLGGTLLLKQGNRRTDTEGAKADDALYRQRILSVINVLKNGAATKSGIIDIIAANLGIADDLPFAKEAKATIRIEEFLPIIEGTASKFPVILFDTFTVENKSTVPAIPEFRLTDITLPALYNIRFVHETTGEFIEYSGKEGKADGIGVVKQGEDLYFLSDGTGLLRGQSFKIFGKMTLPPGMSNIRMQAAVGLPEGIFGETKFDFALFDTDKPFQIGRFDDTTAQFDKAVFAYENSIAQLEFKYKRLHPGSFKAIVPWDIAGFSVEMTLGDPKSKPKNQLELTQSIERLKVLGLNLKIITKLQNWSDKHKKFETAEAFYKALPLFELTEAEYQALEVLIRQHIGDFTVTAEALKPFLLGKLKEIIFTEFTFLDPNLERLKVFGLAQKIITKLQTWSNKNKKFETVEAFYKALPLFELTDPEFKALKTLIHRRIGDFTVKEEDLKPFLLNKLQELILSECTFTDKYARFDISPRAQIKTIVNRVKAAGVYAVVSFEKRFWEHQQLGEALAMTWHREPEIHELTEGDFTMKSIQKEFLDQDMKERFTLAGVFDYTNFDSLNGFA